MRTTSRSAGARLITGGVGGLAAVLLATGVMAGCARDTGGGDGNTAGQPGRTAATTAFNARAKIVIRDFLASDLPDAWRHGFVPLEDLTVLVGDPGFTEATKLAFGYGWYVYQAPVLLPPPQPGLVTFADGSRLSVPLRTSQDAFAALAKAHPHCPPTPIEGTPAPVVPPVKPTIGPPSAPDGVTSTIVDPPCTVLRVTNVELGTVPLLTSRGEATVPAWLFTVPAIGAQVARVAVAPSAITPMPQPQPSPVAIDNVTGASGLSRVDGASVTFRIETGVCHGGITPLVYQTADAVVVGAYVAPDPKPVEACPAIAQIKELTIRLAKPLGTRIALDVLSGQPLTISASPVTPIPD